MQTELFVWYRSTEASAPALLQAGREILAGVQRRCGVQGRLLARQDALHTWMEHYQAADGAQAEQLALALAASVAEVATACSAAGGALPERHTEAFTCLAG